MSDDDAPRSRVPVRPVVLPGPLPMRSPPAIPPATGHPGKQWRGGTVDIDGEVVFVEPHETERVAAELRRRAALGNTGGGTFDAPEPGRAFPLGFPGGFLEGAPDQGQAAPACEHQWHRDCPSGCDDAAAPYAYFKGRPLWGPAPLPACEDHDAYDLTCTDCFSLATDAVQRWQDSDDDMSPTGWASETMLRNGCIRDGIVGTVIVAVAPPHAVMLVETPRSGGLVADVFADHAHLVIAEKCESLPAALELGELALEQWRPGQRPACACKEVGADGAADDTD